MLRSQGIACLNWRSPASYSNHEAHIVSQLAILDSEDAMACNEVSRFL